MSHDRRKMISLIAVIFVSMAGLAMPYPVLAPLFLGGSGSALALFRGLPPEILLGMVVASYPLGTFIGSMILGALSDVVGRRRVMLISLGASVATYAVSAVAIKNDDYLLLLISRFVTGLFEGNIAIARAAAADLSGSIKKTTSFSLLSVATTSGWLVGPLMGGAVSQISYTAVFIAAGILTAGAWLVTFIVFHEKRDSAGSAPPPAPDAFESAESPAEETPLTLPQRIARNVNAFVVLRDPAVRLLLATYLLLTMAMTTYYEFYPFLLVKKWGFDSTGIAMNTAILTAAMAFSNLVLVRWTASRFSAAKNIVVATILFAVTLFALPLPARSESLFVTFPLLGIFIALSVTHVTVYISDHVSEADQGKVMGLLVSLFSLSDAFVALAGSTLSVLSVGATIMIGAGFALAALVVFVAKVRSGHEGLETVAAQAGRE